MNDLDKAMQNYVDARDALHEAIINADPVAATVTDAVTGEKKEMLIPVAALLPLSRAK